MMRLSFEDTLFIMFVQIFQRVCTGGKTSGGGIV